MLIGEGIGDREVIVYDEWNDWGWVSYGKVIPHSIGSANS